MKEWFLGLQTREQRLVLGGGVLAGLIIIYGLILGPLGRATAAGSDRVTQKESDLAWMQTAAADIVAAGGAPRGADPGGPLVVVVDRTARNYSLAVSSSQPTGADSIRVSFDSAPFDTLIEWLASLQSQHRLLIRSATIDATRQPGHVRVTLSLERPTA